MSTILFKDCLTYLERLKRRLFLATVSEGFGESTDAKSRSRDINCSHRTSLARSGVDVGEDRDFDVAEFAIPVVIPL